MTPNKNEILIEDIILRFFCTKKEFYRENKIGLFKYRKSNYNKFRNCLEMRVIEYTNILHLKLNREFNDICNLIYDLERKKSLVLLKLVFCNRLKRKYNRIRQKKSEVIECTKFYSRRNYRLFFTDFFVFLLKWENKKVVGIIKELYGKN